MKFNVLEISPIHQRNSIIYLAEFVEYYGGFIHVVITILHLRIIYVRLYIQ